MQKNYRTEAQNKYYFKCIVIPLGKFLGYHKYEMHEELKRLFIEDTSKELNTVDFNDYCEQIRIWSYNEFNIVLEEPETNK
tara:strand:+ start:1100 stop:1342 length:243 start_codon:yes stop_codon:yes gene_type:complete